MDNRKLNTTLQKMHLYTKQFTNYQLKFDKIMLRGFGAFV